MFQTLIVEHKYFYVSLHVENYSLSYDERLTNYVDVNDILFVNFLCVFEHCLKISNTLTIVHSTASTMAHKSTEELDINNLVCLNK